MCGWLAACGCVVRGQRSSAGAFFDDGVVPRGADEFAVRIAVHDVDAIQFRRSAAQFRRFRLPDGMQIALQIRSSHMNRVCSVQMDHPADFSSSRSIENQVSIVSGTRYEKVKVPGRGRG